MRGDDDTPGDRRRCAARIADLRAKQKQDSIDLQLRWNWNTPFFLSPHNPIDVLLRRQPGAEEREARRRDVPDLARPDVRRHARRSDVSTRTTGGITTDATGAETFGTIVSLNESPMRPGILYAGTDDGRVWMTRNDGGTWKELTTNVTGVPAGTYVSRIEPSLRRSKARSTSPSTTTVAATSRRTCS